MLSSLNVALERASHTRGTARRAWAQASGQSEFQNFLSRKPAALIARGRFPAANRERGTMCRRPASLISGQLFVLSVAEQFDGSLRLREHEAQFGCYRDQLPAVGQPALGLLLATDVYASRFATVAAGS